MHRRGDGNVTTESETGVMTPQGKECWATRSWERQGRILSWVSRGRTALLTPWLWPSETAFRLSVSRNLREYISAVLSHKFVHLLQQPQGISAVVDMDIITLAFISTLSSYPYFSEGMSSVHLTAFSWWQRNWICRNSVNKGAQVWKIQPLHGSLYSLWYVKAGASSPCFLSLVHTHITGTVWPTLTG